MYQDKTFQDPCSCYPTITVPSVVDVERDRVTVSEAVDRPIEDYFFIKIGRGILFLMLLFFIVLPLFWLTLLTDE